jgi:RND family efflux transporter MFP subunit
VVAGVIFALAYWTPHPALPPPGGTAAQTQAMGSLIVTSEPAIRNFMQQAPWTGFVQSVSTVPLTALAAGRVESIPAADQAPVEAGATVMVLGGRLLTAQQARLQANIKSLQAQLALATQTVQALQQSVAAQLATKAELATAQDQQLQLQARLRDAKLELDSSRLEAQVVAPISGIFTNRQVSVGQTVQAGQVLGEIIDPNHLRIVASLFPPAVVALQGREATVRVSGAEQVVGTVGQVLPQASSTGATLVWIEGPQIDWQLRPGQSVAGMVTVESRKSLAVPESAVVYGPREQPYIFLRQQDHYERREVRTGLTQDGWIEIRTGAQPEELVVVKGAYELLHREFSSQYRVED